jgi:hypothetical protein
LRLTVVEGELVPWQARFRLPDHDRQGGQPIFTILSFLDGVVRLAYSTIRLFFLANQIYCASQTKTMKKHVPGSLKTSNKPAPTPIHPSSLISKNGNGYSNHHHGICYFRMDGLAPPALFDKSGCYHTHTHSRPGG